jgi:hypothetical protein
LRKQQLKSGCLEHDTVFTTALSDGLHASGFAKIASTLRNKVNEVTEVDRFLQVICCWWPTGLLLAACDAHHSPPVF